MNEMLDKYYKSLLGEILLRMGYVTEEQLKLAFEEQKRSGVRLGQALIELEYVTEEHITEARAHQLGCKYINIKDHKFSSEVVAMVPEAIARTYNLIAVEHSDNNLKLAMANPIDIEAIDIIQFETKCRVIPALAAEHVINKAIEREYGVLQQEDLKVHMEKVAQDIEISKESEDELDIDEARRLGDMAPIVRMVNVILSQAIRKRASDIHFEPKRNYLNVRYRIDGELQQMKSIPNRLRAAVTSRIKIMSELDISERRLPQDGRLTVKVDGKAIDLRISSNPTIHGERIVIRILNPSHGLMSLDSLGFSSDNLKKLQSLISRPYGILLVTGPTGSGKTTTLYANLNALKSERTNIMTVEDPVEYELGGISQTQVNSKIGLTFANQLRCLLRQDPDIILVGEIRDSETADIAFRAALTGHLVLSTLHCNDAPSGITRLLDMDVEPFLVSSAIIGIIAQRLVRTLCNSCKQAYEPSIEERHLLGLSSDEKVTIYRPKGCNECDNVGYRGRTTINEIMPMTSEISRLALRKASANEVKSAALRAGMIDMQTDAVSKVLAGITSVEEIERKVFFSMESEEGESYTRAA